MESIRTFILIISILGSIPPAMAQGPPEWPANLWNACWKEEKVDFSNPLWEKLDYKEQVKYAASYQRWYAERINKPAEKTMNIAGVPFMLRLIPPGEFWMGSPAEEEKGREYRYRECRHQVVISQAFYIGKYELSQKQWQAVMGTNPSRFKGDDLPVHNVSWLDCEKFCKKTGFQMPTEAQWEYACRAGTTTPFNLGTNITPVQVNYNGNYPYSGGSKGEFRDKTTAVGSLPNMNSWGCYDFHGNVCEWCYDLYDFYPTERLIDPTGASNDLYRRTPRFWDMDRYWDTDRDYYVYRVFRGGGWDNYAESCRSALRVFNVPDCLDSAFGFRICSKIK